MPAESVTTTTPNDAAAQSVEVSGWDAEGQFFVEIADLDPSGTGDITARLCHRVNSGSLVFVRILHGHGGDTHENNHPTANEAQALEPPDFTGRCRIRLTPCQPRTPRRRGD